MARYCGKVGFAIETEVRSGVWKNEIVERTYYGDSFRMSRRLQDSGNLNDNVTISNEISIVADPFANENFLSIRYAEFMGVKWKVTNIETQRPRLLMTLGGVYNG